MDNTTQNDPKKNQAPLLPPPSDSSYLEKEIDMVHDDPHTKFEEEK